MYSTGVCQARPTEGGAALHLDRDALGAAAGCDLETRPPTSSHKSASKKTGRDSRPWSYVERQYIHTSLTSTYPPFYIRIADAKTIFYLVTHSSL